MSEDNSPNYKTPEEHAAEIVKMSPGKLKTTTIGAGVTGMGMIDKKDEFFVLVDGHPIGPLDFTRADGICCMLRATLAEHIREYGQDVAQDAHELGYQQGVEDSR